MLLHQIMQRNKTKWQKENVVVEDDRLVTDDDITSPDNETEHNDVSSDENKVSGSDGDDDWIFIVGVSHDLKRYCMQWMLQYFMFVTNGLTLFVVCLNITVYLLFFVNCQTS